MILLIDNYDSFTFNLKQELEVLGARCEVRRNDEITVEEARSLQPERIVISPGPGRPADAGVTIELIREMAGKLPILGICLGHQAIGEAFGGKVIRGRRPCHGKVSKVQHGGRGLFEGLDVPFVAARYHSLVVEKESLPSCLEVDAESDEGEIMALRHRDLQVFGVQFHPESVATRSGRELLANFLRVSAQGRSK